MQLSAFYFTRNYFDWNEDRIGGRIQFGYRLTPDLTVALQGLQGQTGQGIELIPSAGFVTIIVPLIVFLSLQRFFIRGMTAGAVKG